MALVAFSVGHRLHLALNRLILDLSISLAQPVAIGVDTLLAGLAVLPDLVPFRYPGQAQSVRQDLLDKGLVR
ncbi:hypothetical protein D3C81_1912430 [compost metagenome]